jgi:hypothetical protein
MRGETKPQSRRLEPGGAAAHAPMANYDMMDADMMSIPFFLVVAALAAAWSGQRRVAIALCAAGLLALLALFRLHATDALDIAL